MGPTEYNFHKRFSDTGSAHILKVHGYGIRERVRPPHLLYYLMEYAPYGSLRELINQYSAELKRHPR